MEKASPSVQRTAGIPLWELLVVVGVLIGILLTRYPTLDQLLVEEHHFRQTQTAFQAVEFHRDGIDLLNPVVPVLGEPWSIPFELPLFQAAASVPMSFGAEPDLAMRSTGLAFFTLTGVLLWLLVRRLSSARAALISLALFSFTPFSLLWSRASLIEYLATAASLGWILAALIWVDTRSRLWLLVSVIAGMAAWTVKGTTAIAWTGALAILMLSSDRAGGDIETPITRRWWSLSIVLVPLAAGLAWTMHADSIKSASASTQWLTSSALRSWNIGTISQRLDLDNTEIVLQRVERLLAMRGWLIVLLGALVLGIIRSPRTRNLWTAMLTVPVIGIGVFFNLYVVHDYYLAAISPAIAVLMALSLNALASTAPRRLRPTVTAAVLMATLGFSLATTTEYWTRAYDELAPPPGSIEIRALTSPSDYVLVYKANETINNWAPTIHYYADRRGMTLPEQLDFASVASQPSIDRYRLLWTDDATGRPVDFAAIREWFRPLSANSLLLGGDLSSLGDFEVAGTTGTSQPQSTVELSELSGMRLVCDNSTEIHIEGGEGSVWLRVTAVGLARPVVGPDFIALPSATRGLVWNTGSDGVREPTVLRCAGGGELSIG